jgi:hypothetical protein
MSNMESITAFLNNEEIGFEEHTGDGIIRFNFTGDQANWMVTICNFDDSRQIVVLSVVSSLVPVDRRPEMKEFISEVNFGLLVGNFEMDPKEGEVRFRTGTDVDDMVVDQTLVRNLIYGNVSSMDIYISAINKVIHGNMSHKDAIAMVEPVEA